LDFGVSLGHSFPDWANGTAAIDLNVSAQGWDWSFISRPSALLGVGCRLSAAPDQRKEAQNAQDRKVTRPR